MILPTAVVMPPILILLSTDEGRVISRLKVSISSVILSSVIDTLIVAVLVPARKVALTGLEM